MEMEVLAPAPIQKPENQMTGLLKPSSDIAASIQIAAHAAAVQVACKIMAAKANPRDMEFIRQTMLNLCADATFAEVAFYSVPRGKEQDDKGKWIQKYAVGPSVFLAREFLSIWGNLEVTKTDHGVYESRGADGKINKFNDIEVTVYDVETNSVLTDKQKVKHWQATKDGGYAIVDPARAHEMVESRKSKIERNLVLELVPKSLVKDLKKVCDATIARFEGTKESLEKMIKSFDSEYGVNQAQIEKMIGKPLGAFDTSDIVELRRVFAAIRSKEFSVEDYFDQGVKAIEPPKPAQAKPKDAGMEPTDKPADKPAKSKEKPAEKKPPTKKPDPEPQAKESEPAKTSDSVKNASTSEPATTDQSAEPAESESSDTATDEYYDKIRADERDDAEHAAKLDEMEHAESEAKHQAEQAPEGDDIW